MPRAADLGIEIGHLPSGPTRSIVDVPGVDHATVWRNEPPPPAGRGVARTGVTVIDPGGNLFRRPIPAGGVVLNGAGECTGFITASEWGLAESPIFLALATGLRTERGSSPAHASTVTGRDGNTSSALPAEQVRDLVRETSAAQGNAANRFSGG